MTSNTRLSILKPGRPREPLQDLSQLLPTNDDEETTTTDNHKRRVSFACVNKVKEFETEAECTTLRQTPAYDERFSISSDSYQSSILEASHIKSTFISYADTSKIMNRSKAFGENVDIVELGLHNVSGGARSSGKMSGGDSSMDITSVIVRDEQEYTADYESNSESYYPLNLTKSASARQSMAKIEDPNDKDVLESSSMETTEALPCLMTETIVTDFESFNQTMDISVEEVAAEEEKNSRSSMNHTRNVEKVFYLHENTTLLSEKDIQFTVDAFGDVKDSHVQENIFVQKHLISFPEEGSCAMEEDTSIFRMQNKIINKENDHLLMENTLTEDENCSKLEETETVEREMDISFSKSFVPAKETFSMVSNAFEEKNENDPQPAKEMCSLVSNVPEEVKENDLQPVEETFPLVSNVSEEAKENEEQPTREIFSLVSSVPEETKEKDVQTTKEIFSLVPDVSEEAKEKDSQSLVVNENQKENAMPSENSLIENKTAEPVMEISVENEVNFSLIKEYEEEKKSYREQSLIVEMPMNVSLAESIGKNEHLNFLSILQENPTKDVESCRPLKRKSDSFLPEIPPPEPSAKRHNTEAKSEIALRKETILNQIKKILKSEIPYWTILSTSDSEWNFGALWNRLHLVITLSENENRCTSKLRFIKKDSGIGDEILKVAIAPIIRKYRKKMDELCGKIEDVIIFMKMTFPSINFAKNFAEDFSEIAQFEDISLNNGLASFLVVNYRTILRAKIQVDMRNIDDFSDSSIEVKQNIGHLDDSKVRKIFFEARGDFDFFSKFVKELNRQLNVL